MFRSNRPVVSVALSAAAMLCLSACEGNDRSRELLEVGDWAGARNVLQEDLPAGEGSLEAKGLMLFANAVPDLLSSSTDSWFVKSCALDELGAQYALQPSIDESDRLARLRNDMRRSLTDKGIATADPQEYGAVLRETVRYGLVEHSWKAEHLVAQGAMGLCGVWLGVEGAEQALMAPLSSKAALAKGAQRYLALGGDRVIAPLRTLASDQAQVSSGPASDVLREMLLPGAELSVLSSVDEPRNPYLRVREISDAEGVPAPESRAGTASRPRESGRDRLRGWFGLSASATSDISSRDWASYTIEIDARPVLLFWTWDSQAAIHRLYGLSWSGTEWVRLSIDGQDPHSHTSQMILGFHRPESGESGDLVAQVFDGVDEQVEQVETWAGAVEKKRRAARVLRRSYRLDGASLVQIAENSGG